MPLRNFEKKPPWFYPLKMVSISVFLKEECSDALSLNSFYFVWVLSNPHQGTVPCRRRKMRKRRSYVQPEEKKEDDEKIEMPKALKEPNLSWSQTEGIQTRISFLKKIRNSLIKDISSNNWVFFSLGAWSEVIDLLHYHGVRRRRARQW